MGHDHIRKTNDAMERVLEDLGRLGYELGMAEETFLDTNNKHFEGNSKFPK